MGEVAFEGFFRQHWGSWCFHKKLWRQDKYTLRSCETQKIQWVRPRILITVGVIFSVAHTDISRTFMHYLQCVPCCQPSYRHRPLARPLPCGPKVRPAAPPRARASFSLLPLPPAEGPPSPSHSPYPRALPAPPRGPKIRSLPCPAGRRLTPSPCPTNTFPLVEFALGEMGQNLCKCSCGEDFFSVVVLGCEMSPRTNFESLALRVKFLVDSAGHLSATTVTWRQLRLHATVSLVALIASSLWHCLIKRLLHELVPPLSYFFLSPGHT